jgi:NADPH-dependent 2,4-dienoyl-CoA reductase/sulfur reductase-like enzyme
MSAPCDVVIVGASLAGLRAAEALREGGYAGRLTLVGDEPHAPYDRPPLSKQVLSGWVRPQETFLPRLHPIAGAWRLGVAASGLDTAAQRVDLADGTALDYDRLIIATGTRARPWPVEAEAGLGGMHLLRTLDHAAALTAALEARPSRVLVVGAGFTGSEVASACRDRGIEVTVVEQGSTPLAAALGPVVGGHAAILQRRAGVDLRCGVSVASLFGDVQGRVRGARLSDGNVVEADVVVACLGAVRNTEWLAGSGVQAGPAGVPCDAACRALSADGAPTDDIFVCGDVSHFHHPLAGERRIALEHWGNAINQARVAAANLLRPGSATNATALPAFWSMQFGANFKSVGLPSHGEQVVIVQGALETGRFVAAYGRGGRIVGAIAVNQAQWLPFYEQQILAGAAFPPDWRVVDQPQDATPQPAGFPGATPGAASAGA